SGRQGKLTIATWAAALTPVPPPGKTPAGGAGPAAPPPAVAAPAWETPAPCAAASTAAALTRVPTSRTVSAPDTARNTPTTRRGGPGGAAPPPRPGRGARAHPPRQRHQRLPAHRHGAAGDGGRGGGNYPRPPLVGRQQHQQGAGRGHAENKRVLAGHPRR